MFKHNQDKSITKKFMVPVLIIMVIQSVLFASVFLFGGTISELNNNSFDILNERTINRKNYIENEMIQHWSNLQAFANAINTTTDSILAERSIPSSSIGADSEQAILSAVSTEIIAMLRQSGTTEAFIILNGEDGSVSKSGLSIRDLDPNKSAENNSDLLVERAHPALTKELGIPLDNIWESYFTLPPDDPASAYYYKPFLAAKEYPSALETDLGYWSPPFRLNPNSLSTITYAIPLRTADGAVYGVLGTGVTQDYLVSLMPYDEIHSDKRGAYLLGVSEPNTTNFLNVASSGPLLKQFIGSNQYTVFSPDKVYTDIHVLQFNTPEKADKTVYGSVQPLKLYNTNTPFENDQWTLLGVMEGRYLLDASTQVLMMVLISFLIAIVFGLIFIVIFSKMLTKPITTLAHTIDQSSAELPVTFSKTHIREIDQLASAIEILNRNVAESASKLSQIIQMANISIGAFEYAPNTNHVVITGEFFSLFGLSIKFQNSYSMPCAEFESLMQSFTPCIEQVDFSSNTSIYKIKDKDKTMRWLRFRAVDTENRRFGVVSDVTQEMIEKRKIEYERDYDLLTNLLNRRAFHTIMDGKFMHPESLGAAAFMMWDLDNLKYINDTYGHDYGDEYIRIAANLLKQFIAHNNAVVARMSGDEFYVFLYGFKSEDEVHRIIKTVEDKIAESKFMLPDGKSIRVRASAGISWYQKDADDYRTLIKYADFAMYTVKNTAKGKIAEFNKQLYTKDSFLLHSGEELNKLIDEELVNYVYQPIVDARTGDIFAYEALMRPYSKTLNTPLDVLRIAKMQSKLHHIERLTMFKAARTYLGFNHLPTTRKLFINSLPNQILSDKDIENFDAEFADVLSRFVFEFTEGEELNESMTLKKLSVLKTWHSEIALDDFGTGYNSDTLLLWLNPHYVKLDMSLIRNIDTDINRQLLLENMMVYLKHRGTRVIAEGVETPAEMEALIGYDVDYLQGYYIGMPSEIPAVQCTRTQEIRSLYDNRWTK